MAISDENDRLTIIISKKMKNELKELAELENRSLSNYVVNVLEEHLDSLIQLSLNFDTTDEIISPQTIDKQRNQVGNKSSRGTLDAYELFKMLDEYTAANKAKKSTSVAENSSPYKPSADKNEDN
ncbi:hypothetical protein KDN24_06135 [Bacillus sp. Bva_UNVM-123]|uniref:hypothetical protein n=1 Tax=Bacillus sp. Bva_UNVM-123 TaxID=2829798 RepID=UPI00391F5B8B